VRGNEDIPRLGGGEDARLVRLATGFHLSKAAALLCLGRPVDVPALYGSDRHAAVILRFLRADPGVVTAVTGVERAAAVAGVDRATVYLRPGDRVGTMTSSRERAGFVLSYGDTVAEARRAALTAAELITVDTTDGDTVR
jgi:cysteine synthase A